MTVALDLASIRYIFDRGGTEFSFTHTGRVVRVFVADEAISDYLQAQDLSPGLSEGFVRNNGRNIATLLAERTGGHALIGEMMATLDVLQQLPRKHG